MKSKVYANLGEINAAARIIREVLKETDADPRIVALAVSRLYALAGVDVPVMRR